MEDEKCCMCDKEAEIFQDDKNYCVECWQEITSPTPGRFYN